MKRLLIFFLMCVLTIILASGCATQQVAKCTSPEDNPQHHYLRGMEALEKGDLDAAQGKFERATYCEEKFAPAYGGLAILTAEKSRGQADPGFRKVETDR